jgi:hypothetical protein
MVLVVRWDRHKLRSVLLKKKALQKGKRLYNSPNCKKLMSFRPAEASTSLESEPRNGLLDQLQDGLNHFIERIPLFALVYFIGADLWDDGRKVLSAIVDETRTAIEGTGIPHWVYGIYSDESE